MKYFLKIINIKRGKYLQIYKSYYVPEVKGSRNCCHESLGYEQDLIKKGIPDPESYFRDKVKKMNEQIDAARHQQIKKTSSRKFVGHFLLNSIFNVLKMRPDMNLMTSQKRFRFEIEDFFKTMVAAQITVPSSKHFAYENTISSLYDMPEFSYDQILETINYIGSNYQKFIELLNHHIERVFKRDYRTCFFDCTNYYFEINLEKDDKRRGPSKENRKTPIIGQALLLDSECIPLGMKIYPGNQSEKPYIRELINDLKTRYDVEGKIIQVADKGLNCARNIYAAAIESKDGYIFSKSVHGKGLNKAEKAWLLQMDDEDNRWTIINDAEGKMKYMYKQCVGTYQYHFKSDENDEQEIVFSVKEKRIVMYNPTLAQKQKSEIDKMAEKARNYVSMKEAARSTYGECVKFVDFIHEDKEGHKVKTKVKLNLEKVEEAKLYAGYNMLVTSEIDKDAKEICGIYHNLWQIEDSFRLNKSYLEARPVYVQLRESIYGHFLICYYALTILRLLEVKVFKKRLSAEQIVDFIRDCTVSEQEYGGFVNHARDEDSLNVVKKTYHLSKLSNLYLKTKDLKDFMSAKPLI